MAKDSRVMESNVFHKIKGFCVERIVLFCFKLNPASILSFVLKPTFARARNSLINFMSDSDVIRTNANVAHPPALIDLDIRHKLSDHQVSDLYQKFLVSDSLIIHRMRLLVHL